jgi:hypothetical protein
MLGTTRRVIVSSTPDGRSIIARDEQLPTQSMPQTPFVSLWGTDEVPAAGPGFELPDTRVDFLPASGGFRVSKFAVLPKKDAGRVEDSEAELGELIPDGPEKERAAALVNAVQFVDRPPGLHQTDTIDLVLIVSGEMYMLLDDSVEVLLRAGDWAVQNGAPHAWDNRSANPCVATLIMIGAHVARD